MNAQNHTPTPTHTHPHPPTPPHTHTHAQVYTVTLHGEQLRTDFRVINTGDAPFEFTAALHTYFEVRACTHARGWCMLVRVCVWGGEEQRRAG